MGLTYGYLARGSDVLLKFNTIETMPSLPVQLSALDKMTIPGQAHPLVFDNGNIDGDITIEVNLIDNTPYDVNADWGSTGTILDQYYEMRRVFYNSGAFLNGGKPVRESGIKDYRTTAKYSVFSLVLFFQSGDSRPFSDNFSVYTGDYIRQDKTGLVIPVVPVSISLKKTNQHNTIGIASLRFSLVRNVISFRV